MRTSAAFPCSPLRRRVMLAATLVAALFVVVASTSCERRTAEPEAGASLLERGMSPGHRLLNLEAGRAVPSNSPRIRRADALITGVSGRFRTSKEQVAELALTTRNMIAKEQTEDVLNVLDAALFATEGLPQASVPPLAPVMAVYAKGRLGGANVAEARDVTRAFARVAANEANSPPRR